MAVARKKQSAKSKSGRLRIVAGNWRSRLLDIAEVEGLRPTSERIRETLFNWLAPSLHGSRCLDLYAGTGALGLEALSRGAAEAVFVERSPVAARQLQKNIDLLDARGASVVTEGALDYLQREASGPFDFVFLDPPFADDLLEETCRLLAARDLLAAGARVYLEQDRAKPEPRLPGNWTIKKNKTAGNVRYLLAIVEEDDER
ncbi:MAG: 16S rRNA (guanine(966)-N(2))-methyltransferase RsmD [Chromatiales bacterium]|nr:MAG: 16S rRNA (guanine(966)-N(2))-methyltransferase RsmD [Chromatiales bacterium]